MAGKKLTKVEIELALEKILKRYDEYIYRFFKSPRLKISFEERYFSAVRNGFDLASFLAVEAGVIEELLKKEDAALNREVPKGSSGVKKEGFADRVLKELTARIEKYPEVFVHRDANPEISRLVGALTDLDQRYLPDLQDALKNTNYAFNSQVMMSMDAQLRSLAGQGREGSPPQLTRYLTLLNVFPRDYKAIDREEKAYILETSFFLHDFLDILEQVQSDYTQLSDREGQRLKKVMSYIRGVIEDFRLKDFKRKNI
jgi:hypothetical protein